MKKYLIFPVLLMVLLISVSGCSCKRNFDKEYSGPLLCPTDNFDEAPGHDFFVTSVSGSNPANLSSATEAVLITDQFNEVINWTVRIKGNISGALKTYTGSSNQVALSWVGQSDGQPFFVAEPITVDLILACRQEVYRTAPFGITAPTFMQLPGFLTDFDVSKLSNTPNVFGGAGSTSLKKVTSVHAEYNTIGPSPQGGSFFNIRGSSPTPIWYYAGFEVNPANAATMSPLPGLNSDPSTVYMNFYANCNGVPNSQIQLSVLEHYKTSAAPNIKTRRKNIDLTWTGWKMVSIKLSDIGILDPRKICGTSFGLANYLNQDVKAEANVDMVIFTNDKPLFEQ